MERTLRDPPRALYRNGWLRDAFKKRKWWGPKKETAKALFFFLFLPFHVSDLGGKERDRGTDKRVSIFLLFSARKKGETFSFPRFHF